MTIDLAIKFGSNEIIIYRKGFGIIAKEPAYLAIEGDETKPKIKATGKAAEKLFLSKSSSVDVYQPIIKSEIINEKMATILITEILNNVLTDRGGLTRVSALVAVPCALKINQLHAIERVLKHSGVNKVRFVQNSVCARANLDIDSHAHIMVVDIGKYLTDISILNSYDFVKGRIYYLGGIDMDKCITTFISDNHGLEVSDLTSEAAKNEIASLYDRDLNRTEYIGIDENDKFVKKDIIANEIKVAIVNVYDQILTFAMDMLKSVPKEIAQDVYNNGIMFVGGASSISGLYEYAKKKLEIPIIVQDQPMDSVILGAGKLLLAVKNFIKIDI